MLMAAEPKGWVKFHHCRMCVIDFLEEEARIVTLPPLAPPPPHPSAAPKKPILNTVKIAILLISYTLFTFSKNASLRKRILWFDVFFQVSRKVGVNNDNICSFLISWYMYQWGQMYQTGRNLILVLISYIVLKMVSVMNEPHCGSW